MIYITLLACNLSSLTILYYLHDRSHAIKTIYSALSLLEIVLLTSLTPLTCVRSPIRTSSIHVS